MVQVILSLGLIGAIRNANLFGDIDTDKDRTAAVVETLRLVDGHVPVPASPGLGFFPLGSVLQVT